MAKDKVTKCCVCGKPVLADADCFSMGSDGWRHKKGCGPGTKPWKEKYGVSEIGKMLEKSQTTKPTPKKADPLRKAIKEFCGREKYLRYMDTVNTTSVDWWIYSPQLGIKQTNVDPPLNPEALYEEFNKQNGE